MLVNYPYPDLCKATPYTFPKCFFAWLKLKVTIFIFYQFNAYDSDDDKENKKKKKSSKYDDEESSYDEDSDEDKSGAKKKVRGRGKGKIDGFNTSEIRRFVKSFKKFPKPLDRFVQTEIRSSGWLP